MPPLYRVLAITAAWLIVLSTGAAAVQAPGPLPAPTPAPSQPGSSGGTNGGSTTGRAGQARAQTQVQTLELIAPESASIAARRGKGSVVLWLIWRGKGDVPRLIATDAVGQSNSVPAARIKVAQGAPLSGSGDECVFSVTVVIDAPDDLRAGGGEYVASLLAPRARPIRVRVSEVAVEALSVSPQTVSQVWRLFQRQCTPVYVTNTGNTDITELSASVSLQTTSGLASGTPQQYVWAKQLPLAPSRQTSLDICLPLPELAGTYTGSLALTANGVKTERVPVTVSTRGPTFGRTSLLALPFALFCGLVALALLTSTRLESWFSQGGLARAETAVALADLAGKFRDVATRIAAIASLPTLDSRLHLLANQADALRLGTLGAPDIGPGIVRLTSMLHGAQWTATVLDALDAGRRAAAAPVIDALALPTDQAQLTAYHDAVENAARAAIPSGFVDGATLPEVDLSGAERESDPDLLRRRIVRMARLQRGLVSLVAGFTAYAMFYVNNAAFGSSLDYIGVFVWAVGLTQAGTQVLSQARWPAK